jgi:hypothetical protein
MEPLGLSRRLRETKAWGTITLAIVLVVVPRRLAFSISVEEAYRAIPHRYTPFESKSVKMSSRDAAVLQEFFRLLNLAIVERVQAQTWFQSNGKRGVAFPNYQRSSDGLIVQLEALTIPDSLKPAHRYVIDALKDQRAYFEEWQRTVLRGEPFRYPLVQSSPSPSSQFQSETSASLQRLVQLSPKTERTKQAFFDHLCALDFI